MYVLRSFCVYLWAFLCLLIFGPKKHTHDEAPRARTPKPNQTHFDGHKTGFCVSHYHLWISRNAPNIVANQYIENIARCCINKQQTDIPHTYTHPILHGICVLSGKTNPKRTHSQNDHIETKTKYSQCVYGEATTNWESHSDAKVNIVLKYYYSTNACMMCVFVFLYVCVVWMRCTLFSVNSIYRNWCI